MKKLTLDVETLTVESLETGAAANQDCPTISVTATSPR
jgi:hypothetical protein